MAQQQARQNSAPRRPMSNQEVEQYLGQQYARMLKDKPAHAPVYNAQMSEDIRDRLQMLGRFNQMSMLVQKPKQAPSYFH